MVRSIAISSDQGWGVSGGDSVEAKVWSVSSGKMRYALRGHVGAILSVAISSDDAWIVTGSADTRCGIWNGATGEWVRWVQMESGGIDSVAVSPDATKFVASGRAPGVAVVWDLTTGRRLFELRGHFGQVKSVAYSRDGRRILTGSWDRTIRVWEASEGQELLSLRNEAGWIKEASFAADDRSVVSIGFDWTYRIWRAARSDDLETWRHAEIAAVQAVEQLQKESYRLENEDRQRVLRDPGCIKQWRVVGPFPLADFDEQRPGNLGVQSLEMEHVASEARLASTEEMEPDRDLDPLDWKRIDAPDAQLDFGDLFGVSHGVAFAACTIVVAEQVKEVRMRLGGDGLAKVYLNGEPVFVSYREYGSPRESDRLAVDLNLRRGRNTLLLKSVSMEGAWTESVRLTDRDGKPLPNLTIAQD